jgi:hypothetical protein
MESGDVALHLAVTSQEILKKTFTIPILPKNELKEGLTWSTSKVVSTPLEEMLYENVMLGEVDERGIKKDEILFVGSTKGFINRLLAVCEDAGFRKVELITDTALLYPVMLEEVKEASVAVIDIGGRQTGIYMIAGKKLRFVREIMTASESFSDALISGFGFSYQEAETYKQEKGFNEESDKSLSLPLDRLGAEIQRTFNVYGQRYPDRPVTRVYLAGRGGRMPNLMERLREDITEETDHLAIPAPVDDHFFPCYCMCSTTEALVNLLPPEVKERGKEEQYKKWVRIGSIALLAVFLVLSLEQWSSLSKAKLALQVEKAALSQKRQQAVATQTTLPFARYIDLASGLKDLRAADTSFLTLMKFLSSRLPGGVYLKEVEFNRQRRLKMPVKEQQKETSREDESSRDVAKNVIKEMLQRGVGKEVPEKKDGPKSPVQPAKEDKSGLVTLSGYIVADTEAQGVILLDMIIQFEKSGFMDEINVISKETTEIKGKKVMQFIIEARYIGYEV